MGLPSGTVTFLFTDIEGSTRLLHELGDAYAAALAEHRRVLREAFARHGGVEVDTQGDAFFVAFARASDAVAAARDAQAELGRGPVRVRMGLHTGEPTVTPEGYVGMDVHRAARVAAAGHGGQVLLSQATRDLVDAAVRDLGDHRLKDLSAPERIFQLGNGEFPRLKTLYQTNLPVQPGPLIGRTREVAEVTALVRGAARLLTLTGAGGSGKTRLALHAAAELADDFADGVWFVALAPLTDPSLVAPTIARAVGAEIDLAAHLRDKNLLLVLDNFEQVLDSAPDVAVVVAGAPGVRAIATSRERLHLSIEREYEVPTLRVEDAASLFVDRARRFDPNIELSDDVRDLVRSLDGLPLAIELAAARVKVLSSRQIRDRLDNSLDLLTGGDRDLPARQQTLRATMEWSYLLLDESSRRALAALSIFPATFDLEAADAVAGADIDMVASLVDKNLLRRAANHRFFMLATIREFARGKLEAGGREAEVRAAHAAWYLAFAERHRVALDAETEELLNAVELEHDNFRAALRWYEAIADGERELELASALARFWYAHGHLREGRGRLEHARAHGRDATLRGDASRYLAIMAYVQGERAAAAEAIADALAFYNVGADESRLAAALQVRGSIASASGDLDAARADYAVAEEVFRRLGNERAVAVVTGNLAYAALLAEDDDAVPLCEAAAAAARAAGAAAREAIARINLAFAHVRSGDADAAARATTAAARLARPLEYTEALVYCVEASGAAAALRGDGENAVRLLAAADAARAAIGMAFDAFEARIDEEARSRARSLVSDDAFTVAWCAGAQLSLDDALALGLALD